MQREPGARRTDGPCPAGVTPHWRIASAQRPAPARSPAGPRIQPRRSLILQPHHDDAALSCGAAAAAWAARGAAVEIVTVFGGAAVSSTLSSFAAWKHSRWQLDDPARAMAVRRSEDARAAAILGCGIRWLGFRDAIYREDRYTSDALLYGPIHPDERGLAGQLADEVRQLPSWAPGTQIFVPLGVGSHVDHQLVFETGRCLAGAGMEVWAYEDLPYAIHSPARLAERLAQLGDAVDPDCAVVPAGRFMAMKLAAISSYQSQLKVIFRFAADYREAIGRHAARCGGERFWRVRSPRPKAQPAAR